MIEQGILLKLFLGFWRISITQTSLHLTFLFVIHDVFKLTIYNHGSEKLMKVAT